MSTLEDRLAGNSNSVPWIPDTAKAQKYRDGGKDCKGIVQRPGQPDYHDYRVVTDRIKGGQIRWAGDGGDVESYVAPQAPPAAAEVRHESAPAGYEHSDDDVPF
jgi:hypothetical protein